jgi:hypothetical protein
MDERDLERLLSRYADELSDDELDAVLPAALQARLRIQVDRETGGGARLMRVGLWSLGVAACLALLAFLVIPRGPIKRFTIAPELARASSAAPSDYVIGLELNQPAYVRVVVVDTRGQWRLALFGAAERKIDRANIRISRDFRLDDPRGTTKVLFAMIITARGSPPTEQDLRQCMPELLAGQTPDRAAIARALQRIAHDLESRFHCAVAFQPVPAG